MFFSDQGSELSSRAIHFWTHQKGVRIDLLMSDNPTANVHVESFDGTFRQGCLNAHRFITLSPAKEIIEAWRREYNENRSQKVLGERTSNEFACQFATSRNLTSLQDVANSLGSWYEKPGPLSS